MTSLLDSSNSYHADGDDKQYKLTLPSLMYSKAIALLDYVFTKFWEYSRLEPSIS